MNATPTTRPNYLIRDGLLTDIPQCLALQHEYQTDHVWQMRFQRTDDGYQVFFQTERLPRAVEIQYEADENRLKLMAVPDQCFLVAAYKDTSEILGYLVMWNDRAHGIGCVQDIVVDQPVRRFKIGTHLLKIARQWAQEHQLVQLLIETQTKNYPAIQFCQSAGLTFCGFNDQYFSNRDIAVFFGQSIR